MSERDSPVAVELSPTRPTPTRRRSGHNINDSFDTSVTLDPHNTSTDPRYLVASSVEIFDLREQVKLMKEQVLDAQEESRRAKLLCVQVRKELYELTKQEGTSQTYSAIASLLGNTTSLVEKFALFEQYLKDSIAAETQARDTQLRAQCNEYTDEQSRDVSDGVRRVLESFRGQIQHCSTLVQEEGAARVADIAQTKQLIAVEKEERIADCDDLRRYLKESQESTHSRCLKIEGVCDEVRTTIEDRIRDVEAAQRSALLSMEVKMHDIERANRVSVEESERTLMAEIRSSEARFTGRFAAIEGKVQGSKQLGDEVLGSVDDRFRHIQKTLEAVVEDRRKDTAAIDAKLGRLENRVDESDRRQSSGVDEKMRRFETVHQGQWDELKAIAKVRDQTLQGLEFKLSDVASKMDSESRRTQGQLSSTVEEIERRLEQLSTSHGKRISAIEERSDESDRTRSQFKSSLEAIERRVEIISDSHSRRISAVEESSDAIGKAQTHLKSAVEATERRAEHVADTHGKRLAALDKTAGDSERRIRTLEASLVSTSDRLGGDISDIREKASASERRLEDVAQVAFTCGTQLSSLQQDQARLADVTEAISVSASKSDTASNAQLANIQNQLNDLRHSLKSHRDTAHSEQLAAVGAVENKIVRLHEAALGAQDREWKQGLAALRYQTKLALGRLLQSSNARCVLGNIFTRWKARATGKIMKVAMANYHAAVENGIRGQLFSRDRLLAKRLIAVLGNPFNSVPVGGTAALQRMFSPREQQLLSETFRKLRAFAAMKFNPRARLAIHRLGQDVGRIGESQGALRGDLRKVEDNLAKFVGTGSASLSPDEKSLIAENPRGAFTHLLHRFFNGESSFGAVLRALFAHAKYFDQDQLRQDEDVRVLSDWVRVIDEEIRKVQRCVRPAFK